MPVRKVRRRSWVSRRRSSRISWLRKVFRGEASVGFWGGSAWRGLDVDVDVVDVVGMVGFLIL